jgi:PIN domain nuclease of toxin-antitoxin system
VNSIVLDSSAILAMIQGERGGERVEALLDSIEAGADLQVYVSWVNWCEVLTRNRRDNPEVTADELTAVLAGVELVPFAGDAAELAAGYAQVNQALSLGDRACLALAKSLNATAWTTERLWTQCELDVPIEMIRP